MGIPNGNYVSIFGEYIGKDRFGPVCDKAFLDIGTFTSPARGRKWLIGNDSSSALSCRAIETFSNHFILANRYDSRRRMAFLHGPVE